MTAKDLFEAVGLVDEDLIEEADAPVPGKKTHFPAWRRALPLAACFCLAVGAVLAWRRVSGSSLAGSEAQAQLSTATAPESENPPLPEVQAEAGAAPDAPVQAENAPDMAAAPEERGTADRALDALLPAEVADAITPAAGDGGGAALAASAGELLGTAADPAPAAWPDTMPVYRSPLADGSLDEAGMRDTLRQVLEALGRDPDLAQDAVLAYNWSPEEVGQADRIAAELLEQFGTGSMLEFWGGLAQLELTLDDGSTLTVRNDQQVTLDAADSGSLHPLTGQELAANAGLLAALGGYDTLCSPQTHSWTDGSALPAQPELTGSGLPGRMTGLLAETDGRLAAFTLSGAARAEQVAELAVLPLDEAEALLQNGGYLGVGYEGGEPSQGSIVDARLGYLSGDALYYVPVWQFTVDFGPAEEASYPAADPDTGAVLHAYFTYWVPAVDADALTSLITQSR
ncbi:hypothetical protein [uncultured Gemmiger sp.]|uniref:hypothetical protein n=1 Tax=uncultured Gemmiger sp. TaxID=1623490 RepID=UPI0025CED481|nr:hypothetical protein [uncultured Gemmiger sp.]